jgi:TatD DNase family protein
LRNSLRRFKLLPMASSLVDYHCHLDLYADHNQAFAETASAQVEVLAVTTTPRAFSKNRELASGHPSIRVGLGLHPQLIAEGHDELQLFEKLLPEARYVGEIGLDAGPRFFKSMQTQRRVFERVLMACAEQGGKILSIHSVRSARDVLTLLERCFFREKKGKAVLHWFGGSKAEAKRASDLGCYFSINREMLSATPRRELVASLPIDRLLTETDGPFTVTDDRPSRPADVQRTVFELAPIFKMQPDSLRAQIHANLCRLESL